MGSAALGAAPGAALFFVTYDRSKAYLQQWRPSDPHDRTRPWSPWAEPIQHMVAASAGEVAACMVRVPTEVVKQRAQARQHPSSLAALQAILDQRQHIGTRATIRQLYRGWNITLLREVPFTVIQFPLWEAMKESWRTSQEAGQVSALASAIFGSLSGAVAAAATTPLDVIKTRTMLASKGEGALSLLKLILKGDGPSAFFAGLIPRVIWISAGGFVFLGSYQLANNALSVAS